MWLARVARVLVRSPLAGAVLIASARASEPVSVDVTRTIPLTNAEVVAMGGAGAAFATGGFGLLMSPAAPANRRVEWVAPVAVSPALLSSRVPEGQDVGDLGAPSGMDLRLFDIGAAATYRGLGFGVLGAGAVYATDGGLVAVVEGHAPVAVSVGDRGLTVGVGPRLLGVRMVSEGLRSDYGGVGLEAGAILANWRQDWSFALALRSGVAARPVGTEAAGIERVRLPAGLLAGIGWSNVSSLPTGSGGVPVRLVADVGVDGPVAGAWGLEGVWTGDPVARGGWITASPRVGAEVDVVRDQIRLRGGSYWEPSRTLLAGPRPHVTGGVGLSLFRIAAPREGIVLDLAWQAGVDVAPRYYRGAWLGFKVWQRGLGGGRAEDRPPDTAATMHPARP